MSSYDDLIKRMQPYYNDLPVEGMKVLDELINALRATQETLTQIAVVCTDNMDRDCNHRMALDFVRNVANTALSGEEGKSE